MVGERIDSFLEKMQVALQEYQDGKNIREVLFSENPGLGLPPFLPVIATGPGSGGAAQMARGKQIMESQQPFILAAKPEKFVRGVPTEYWLSRGHKGIRRIR